MPDDGRMSIAEILGEFFRDAGVLVLVFYPLEMKSITRYDREIILFVSALFLAIGIILERTREP